MKQTHCVICGRIVFKTYEGALYICQNCEENVPVEDYITELPNIN